MRGPFRSILYGMMVLALACGGAAGCTHALVESVSRHESLRPGQNVYKSSDGTLIFEAKAEYTISSHTFIMSRSRYLVIPPGLVGSLIGKKANYVQDGKLVLVGYPLLDGMKGWKVFPSGFWRPDAVFADLPLDIRNNVEQYRLADGVPYEYDGRNYRLMITDKCLSVRTRIMWWNPLLVLLPVTLAVDIVTFPFLAVGLILMATGGPY